MGLRRRSGGAAKAGPEAGVTSAATRNGSAKSGPAKETAATKAAATRAAATRAAAAKDTPAKDSETRDTAAKAATGEAAAPPDTGRKGRGRRSSASVAPTEAAAGRAGTRRPLTAKRAKRWIGVATTVGPLVAPYVMTAAGRARAWWDDRRAARLGVPPDQLARFAGPGGALHARVSHVAASLTDLESAEDARATEATRHFVTETRPRLADLSVAVRAAEQMPADRRRAAFRAISGELDRTEAELLVHLGIPT